MDKYETHLRANGCNDGGIGVRMRELRAVFNDAIKKGVTQEKYYPFKIYKVSKLKPSQWPVIEANESKYVSRINTRKNNWSILLGLEYVGELYQTELFELFPSLKPYSTKTGIGRVYSGGISTVSKAKRAAKKK